MLICDTESVEQLTKRRNLYKKKEKRKKRLDSPTKMTIIICPTQLRQFYGYFIYNKLENLF